MEKRIRTELVKELRAANNWTQEALAEKAGVSLRTVQRLEKDGVASFQTRVSVARALGVPLAKLEYDEDAAASTSPAGTGARHPSRAATIATMVTVASLSFAAGVLFISPNSQTPVGPPPNGPEIGTRQGAQTPPRIRDDVQLPARRPARVLSYESDPDLGVYERTPLEGANARAYHAMRFFSKGHPLPQEGVDSEVALGLEAYDLPDEDIQDVIAFTHAAAGGDAMRYVDMHRENCQQFAMDVQSMGRGEALLNWAGAENRRKLYLFEHYSGVLRTMEEMLDPAVVAAVNERIDGMLAQEPSPTLPLKVTDEPNYRNMQDAFNRACSGVLGTSYSISN